MAAKSHDPAFASGGVDQSRPFLSATMNVGF